MTGESRADEDLLVAARDDPEAFGAFYRRHADAVLNYLLLRTRDADRSLDLTAETFAIALAHRRRYRPERGPARAWLFGIAKNVLRDSHRKAASATKTRRKLGMQILAFDDAELERVEALIDAQRSAVPLTCLVEGLAPEQREAVLARVVDERDYRDISAELDVSEHTVRQRVSRGLARLTKLKEERDNA
ncbi:MAG TPA: RNA polymerase sigma factor [Solirubrobacteraceae bacterium]